MAKTLASSIRSGMSLMQFDELVAGATVRFTFVDGVQYLSVRDFIMVVCDQDQDRAGKTWRNLSEDRKNEVRQYLTNFKFTGRGQQIQPTITFPGALKLIMWLPGEKAKTFRTTICGILKRYFAGDPSLLDDIQANAASNAPLNQAARESLRSDAQGEASLEHVDKRQKLLVPTAEELQRCKDYTVFFKDFLDLRKKETHIEIMHKREMMMLDLEKNKIENKIRRDELRYKKALKALEDAKPPATVSVAQAIPDPPQFTTILKMYEAHKAAFPLIRPEQRKAFLVKAGSLAAQGFITQFGIRPGKLNENGFDVNAFPVSHQSIVMDALRSAYRESVAGRAQPTIATSFAGLVEIAV